jgi:hypothetical protein
MIFAGSVNPVGAVCVGWIIAQARFDAFEGSMI